MKVVIDTNVIVSYILGSSKSPFKIWQLVLTDKIIPLLSIELFQEIAETLHYPKLQKYIDTKRKTEVLSSLSLLINTQITTSIDIVRDQDDNKILEIAISGNAQYIVTGDNDLLTLREYQGIKIMKPTDFLRLVEVTPK